MAATTSFVIRTPCSSANIGPGFDVIGLALSLYLELRVTIDRSRTESAEPLNCRVTYEGEGADTGEVPLEPDRNLITRVALYVLRCHGVRSFPRETHVHIKNPIPLGRGLGSSGAAVVAGVMLGKEIGALELDELKHMTEDRLFDFCLMIERHPDNVGAALFGGFVGTYLNPLTPEEAARAEIPLSEVLPAPAGGVDTGKTPPAPPKGIGHHIKFPWAPEIKVVAIVPNFEVATADARSVLPAQYPRSDVTFNLQRIALLPVALGQSPPDASLIHLAMQDKLHQPYRQSLIPGLDRIVKTMTPATHPGLLGVCLSGAGPTILALVTEVGDEAAGTSSGDNNKAMATNIKTIVEDIQRTIVESAKEPQFAEKFAGTDVKCVVQLLEPAEGTKVEYLA